MLSARYLVRSGLRPDFVSFHALRTIGLAALLLLAVAVALGIPPARAAAQDEGEAAVAALMEDLAGHTRQAQALLQRTPDTDQTAQLRALRADLAVIADHVAPGSRVLDIGCGDGALMLALREKQCDVRGIEIDGASVERCVAQGLSVVQGDADRDLRDYPDKGFDYAVLSQTLQTAVRPDRPITSPRKSIRMPLG